MSCPWIGSAHCIRYEAYIIKKICTSFGIPGYDDISGDDF